MIELMIEWIYEWADGCGRMIEWMSGWTNECMNEWISKK